MAERRPSLVPLVTGLLSLLLGGLYLLDRSGAADVDGGVAAAAAVLAVGLTAAVRSVVGLTRSRRS